MCFRPWRFSLWAVGHVASAAPLESTRPNIIWIIPDDMSANFSCYGETGIATPNVDKLAPYYPNHPDILRDWAAYLDAVRVTDLMVGEVLARLEEEGIRDKTLVLFMTDHGISHARGK